MRELRKLVEEAVEAYNRYRRPEAVAAVIRLEGGLLTVRFQGPFCATCGVSDWLEDLGYELKALDPAVEFRITRAERTGELEYTVEFELTGRKRRG